MKKERLESMEFKQLESYIAIVKYKNLTTAAEKLGISQPTISVHLKNLEEELHTRLIIRTAKNFEVTQRGQEFFVCAQNILKLRDDLINSWNGREAEIIRMGVSTIPSAYILPEVLPAFGKAHENVYFSIDQMDSQRVIDEVHKGTYDLGLVGMKTEDELLAFEKFYQDKLVVITPVKEKFLRMKEQQELPVEHLFQEPVILREEGSGSGKSAGKFLEKMGIREDKLHIAARINDQESIKNLVAGGLGISIVSEKAVKDYVESRRLLQFSLPEEFSGREFYIVYQKNYILKECAGEFIRFLKMYQKNL